MMTTSAGYVPINSVKPAADPGGLRGQDPPQAMQGVLYPPFSLANMTVKDNVHRHTSELVSM